MTLQNPRCYTIAVGPFELRHWGDDRTAQRIAKRWTRRYFAKRSATLRQGSIAEWIASIDPTVNIYRHNYHPARGVAGFGHVLITSYQVRYNLEQ